MEVALSIRETIGPFCWPKDIGEMKGRNFMMVKVEVDITKPLCRGRKISWNHSSEAGQRLCMSVCQTYATSVGLSRTTTKTAIYG